MKNLTKDISKKILANEIPVETLLSQFPEYKNEVFNEINLQIDKNDPNLIYVLIEKYTIAAKVSIDKITKSGFNEKTLNAFMPNIIKARFALFLLEQLRLSALANKHTKKIRLNLWDGFILQKLLFKNDLVRKPASLYLFKFFWKFISNKQSLMPLVNEKGIYCFYSRELIKELSTLTEGKECLEIGAGDGTLTRFLNAENIHCTATDDYSWEHCITYPDFVEKADAKAALQKYNPEVVICSWPVPKNTYEKHVFKTNSVNLYIVIGTRNPAFTGDIDSYLNAANFTMEYSEKLSSLVLPPSNENAVYLFRRKESGLLEKQL
ncbi:hypothetical protein SAMN05880501_104269 [Ureibacillus xyleni]|uniref:SAM-dependent methyltransferase n=1 Tax=Ureibacillus xyleni TaxID=614648 RepID=A0A285SEQ3_9BACL|nr:class I SAM-dependent methyltransferase [Ureibacillus xyleni]SOC06402.1 hypothetical protein SAMN05880501_104269 [Ureibacillus xyleni]